jgi:hypothetical protein
MTGKRRSPTARHARLELAVGAALVSLVVPAACSSDDRGGPAGASATGGSADGSAGTSGNGGTQPSGGAAGNSGSGGSSGNAGSSGDAGSSGTGGGAPKCNAGASTGAVAAPMFWKKLSGETSWYASPVVADLDADGKNELIAAYYSLFVFDDTGKLIHQAKPNSGRIYAPHVVADLDADGTIEIVVGSSSQVTAYEWKNKQLAVKAGWPTDTTTAGNAPEVRGLAASDLDGDGQIEVVATTTQTASTASGGSQVFAYRPNGMLYQPSGIAWQAWPRYNAGNGTGGDADRNGQGHSGYGCYGLNVGIGNIDDDPALEILVTYDNHHIQAFNHDGVAIDSAPWFKNRASQFDGQRLTWGQFIRWADPKVEGDHYNLHTGEWPSPTTAEWLQWTASPPNVVDLDGDGKNEVVGVPNVEKNDPYETQAYAVVVLEGAHGDGSRSAMRKAGWETLPRGGTPIAVDGYYPPLGIPAPVAVDVAGDGRPEIVVSLNDGRIHAFAASGAPLWQYDFRRTKPIAFASEVTVADLNQDGIPELLFATYGAPTDRTAGHLIVLGSDGKLLHDVLLPNPGSNGNGNGAPAAPAVYDLDGDGGLEIFVQTFDHGMDVFKVPGSGKNCVLWPTARGGPLRSGRASSPPP